MSLWTEIMLLLQWKTPQNLAGMRRAFTSLISEKCPRSWPISNLLQEMFSWKGKAALQATQLKWTLTNDTLGLVLPSVCEDMIDHRCYIHNLVTSCEIEAWKNSGLNGMINHVFTSFSAVQIYDLSYIHLFCSFCKAAFHSYTPQKTMLYLL